MQASACEALGWLSLIPTDRHVLRRIVAVRCLVAPLTGRHLYSWRQLGVVIGADHRAVQRWHADGLRLIARGLRGVARADISHPVVAVEPPDAVAEEVEPRLGHLLQSGL